MKANKYWKAGAIGLILSGLTSTGSVPAQSLGNILDDYLNKEEPAAGSGQSIELEDNAQPRDIDLKSQLFEMAKYMDSAVMQDLGMFEAATKNLPGNDKIAASLRLLMTQEKSLDITGFEDKAFQLGVEARQQSVYVTITSEFADQSKAIESSLAGEFISQFENKTYALVPVSELEALAEKGSVYSIEPQAKVYPFTLGRSGDIVSEGVRASNVAHLHKANITGKGVKVGILDFGFARYNELQQKREVPAPIASKAFSQSGKLENGNVHGTACAEIIHDMAPDAELYLAAIDGSEGQLVAAAIWLAKQGVDIISFSGGGHGGPHNGMAILDKLVEYITEKHAVLWVNAAGNDGKQHLPLKLEDRDGNRLIDIAIEGKQIDMALIQWMTRGDGMIYMVWDDWGQDPTKPSSTQDLDMYLSSFDPRTKKWTLVAKSENPQNGRGRPFEAFAFKQGQIQPGSVFSIKIAKKNATRPVAVHVYASNGIKLLPNNPVGSIGIPATSAKALAVGAVDVRNTRLEPFSSQGPTDDGRMKPDVSAPDHNLTMSYGKENQPGRFPGTSASCPHVSGFAALLRQHSGVTKPQELRQLVEKNVRLLEGNGPDNRYGHGYITAQAIKVGAGQPDGTDNGNEPSAPDDPVNDLQRALDDILGR